MASGTKIPLAKKYQPFLKIAQKNGARLVKGTKHLQVFDGEELVIVLPYGRGQYEGRGDLKWLEKVFRERGWT